MLKQILKISGSILAGLVIVLLGMGILFYFNYPSDHNPTWGVNFSTSEARAFGFEPIALLTRIITDLQPAHIRLTTYWEEIEPIEGQYSFSETDALLNLADEHNVDVILVVGHKQPRWPECHHPNWWIKLEPTQQQPALTKMLTTTVEHFKPHSSIKAWQVENEPLFDYGLNCPILTRAEIKSEVALVKQLDSRPIILTDSGEKGPWLFTAWSGADILGSTMYREVYQGNQRRYRKYHLPAFTYTIKAGMVKALSSVQTVLGVELQAEPWFNGNPYEIPLDKQFELMNPQIFADNVAYAKQSGFSQHYFWGVEWWYWMKDQNSPDMLEAAKKVFNKSQLYDNTF